jgi:hypothetical protein
MLSQKLLDRMRAEREAKRARAEKDFPNLYTEIIPKYEPVLGNTQRIIEILTAGSTKEIGEKYLQSVYDAQMYTESRMAPYRAVLDNPNSTDDDIRRAQSSIESLGRETSRMIEKADRVLAKANTAEGTRLQQESLKKVAEADNKPLQQLIAEDEARNQPRTVEQMLQSLYAANPTPENRANIDQALAQYQQASAITPATGSSATNAAENLIRSIGIDPASRPADVQYWADQINNFGTQAATNLWNETVVPRVQQATGGLSQFQQPQASQTNIPSWVTPPTGGGGALQGLQTLTNPVTGETWTAPTSGYTVNAQQFGQPQPFLGGNMATSLNPQNLPPLRGAASGTSSIDPTLRPYLELGLRGAEQLFLQQQPSLYPGQMFVGPSPQTQAALNMQEDIALAQPTALQAAQESYMRGLGGLGATAGGAFLMGNPYQQAAIASASRPIFQQYEQQVLPGITSMFSGAGRYGSEAMGRSLGQATEATARALGDVGTQIAYSGYEAERGRQQQAMAGQLQAATLAPQIYGQQFLPSQQLAQVGAAREAIAGQPLQEAIQRYQFQQQMPYQQLQGFLSSIYGTPMAASQYAPPAQTNRAASTLGGAALGAGIGQMIGGGFGGFSAPAIGAGLGALGGLLF